MKSTFFHDVPEEFRRIFLEPFCFMDCHDAPELVQAWRSEDDWPHRQNVEVRRLGREPGKFIHSNAYAKSPDICLYRLRDVPMFHSLAFSKSGGVFPPSLRYRQPGGVTGFSLPRPVNPRPLGGGYFAYLTKPKSSKATYFKDPAMPFYTFPEYGHYLMESLPSLHFLSANPALKLVLHPETGAVPAYLKEMVAPFGLDESAFVIADELSVFRDLYLPSRLYMESQYLNGPARAVYGRIARHYAGEPPQGGPRLYLSRRGVGNRRLVNEDEIERLFEDRGFEAVRPESLPFADQVRLFSQATHVAGALGTALHNTVFSLAPERLKVLLLAPEGLVVAGVFYQLESDFGRAPQCVFGRYLDPDVPRDIRLTFYGPWRIEPEDVEAALDQWLEDGP